MKDIAYAAPRTLSDAVRLLTEHGARARVLAGGTDLIVQLRENTLSRRLGGADPDTIVDVKGIPELTQVAFDPATGLTIGAAAPCSRIYESPAVQKLYPSILDAASLIGSVQIQNRASFGGNLCNASPAADGIPPLIALGATLRISGRQGSRSVPVEDFCVGPGRTLLAPGEMLVSISVPAPHARSGAKYLRFIPRNEMDIAVVGVSSMLELDSNLSTICGARVALAAVAPTPLLVKEAAQALIGKKAGPEAFEAAAEASRKAAKPITDMRGEDWQRRHLAGVLTVRTLEDAFARALKGPGDQK